MVKLVDSRKPANPCNGRYAQLFARYPYVCIYHGVLVSESRGTCLLRPEAFRLQSDTIRWSIKMNSGGECIQGLRWSTILIDSVSVVE